MQLPLGVPGLQVGDPAAANEVHHSRVRRRPVDGLERDAPLGGVIAIMLDPSSPVRFDAHLAAGDGWVVSRGQMAATGEQVLLLSTADEDVAELRRRLAVAGSVAVGHLAAVLTAEQSADGGVVVAVSAPAGPSLADVAGSRGRLAAGEVVTLVAPLAATLATLHARGVELADVTAATVWLASDGLPVLLPVGCRDASGAAGVARGDVAALARLGLEVLEAASSGAACVAAALQEAVAGRLDATGLAAAVLRCTKAMPIAAPSATVTGTSAVSAAVPRRRPAVRALAVLGAVVVVAIVLGGLWGPNDGGVLVASRPLSPLSPPPSVSLTPAPPASRTPGITATVPAAARHAQAWHPLMAALERARARAYSRGDPAGLSAVYAARSPTGRADLRLLRGLARRGLRAARLQAFVEHVHVVTGS